MLGSSPFILTKFDAFMNWVRGSSMFVLQFGIACCTIEMMGTLATKHDLDRFAAGVPRASPRQADLIIVPGTIVSKFAPRMKRVYDQMPEPKFVVSMGSCTISGGPFQEGYNVIKGAEQVIPVDIHVPGCPPRPEALIYGVAKLQESIAEGESSPVTVKPYELEQFGDLKRDELVDKLASEIDEDDLAMRYDWSTP
ncbi:NADH dehydrogenase/oxidoreductase [Haloarcula argentinensis DSM 12282]|nr:NADH dehydrogenase/oxidoreductase [Haloarcula argentinensis DSM 12282]